MRHVPAFESNRWTTGRAGFASCCAFSAVAEDASSDVEMFKDTKKMIFQPDETGEWDEQSRCV